MTEEMKQKLSAKLTEEANDMMAYDMLADECELHGCYHAAEVLHHIAAEERSHHEWIKSIME